MSTFPVNCSDAASLKRSVLHRFVLVSMAVALVSALSGCATLPSSGPTGNQVRKTAQAGGLAGSGVQIVELTDRSVLPPVQALPAVFPATISSPPTNLIGVGDILDIAVYEAGVSLFGNSGVATVAGAFDPSAKVEKLPPVRVDDSGNIRLPFIGKVRAAGLTTTQLEALIRSGYSRMSQNPQVLLSIREVVSNSVILSGELVRPGRLPLATNGETVADAISLAGGYRGEAKDISVRVSRGHDTIELRLSDVLAKPEANFPLLPGDRIILVKAPRSFSVMGGAGRVEQVPFSGPNIALSEAIALSGGANANVGDPKAIFVFRYVPDGRGGEKPLIYHLNLMQVGAYFISQRFAMQDKDILYIGNAEANQPSKLVQIISQLFAPIVTLRDVARSTGN